MVCFAECSPEPPPRGLKPMPTKAWGGRQATAAEIARALGGGYLSGDWWRCRCPVHNSQRATLALRDRGTGLIVHCHAGCDRRDILEELSRRGLTEDRFGYSSLLRSVLRADAHGSRQLAGCGRQHSTRVQRRWCATLRAAASPYPSRRHCAGRLAAGTREGLITQQ